MKKTVQLSLILPCYNEEKVFAHSVRQIQEVLDVSRLSYEIIFVDDKSQDNTVKLIKNVLKQAQNTQRYQALFHVRNLGRGQSVMDGIKMSVGEVIGFIDIDCEISPVYIPVMANQILQHMTDICIGKRFYRTTMSSLVREVLSRGYMWLSDRLLSTGGMDTETGYKFFNRAKILPYLKEIENRHWFWDTEIMVISQRAGLRIRQFPVLFLRRFDKTSTVNAASDTYEYLFNLWRFRKKLLKEQA